MFGRLHKNVYTALSSRNFIKFHILIKYLIINIKLFTFYYVYLCLKNSHNIRIYTILFYIIFILLQIFLAPSKTFDW